MATVLCILLWTAGEQRADIRENDGFITCWTRAYTQQRLPGWLRFIRCERRANRWQSSMCGFNYTLKRKDIQRDDIRLTQAIR